MSFLCMLKVSFQIFRTEIYEGISTMSILATPGINWKKMHQKIFFVNFFDSKNWNVLIISSFYKQKKSVFLISIYEFDFKSLQQFAV